VILRENPDAAVAMIAAAKAARAAAHPRAEGLHVSDLVYCLRRAWYRRHGYPEPESIEQDTIFLMGEGHHGLLQCQGEYEVPVQLDLDGITVHGTIDLIPPDDVTTEIKTTRYSANKDVANGMAHYIDQLASYVLARGHTRGRLAIWHLMGDYNRKNGQPPLLRVWDIEFEPAELDAWRDELAVRADVVVNTDTDDDPLFGAEHYTWECDYCPFNQTKGGPCPGGPGRDLPFFIQNNLPGWAGGD
jgi:hypothetical protein